MCGIMGVVGSSDAAGVILKGLGRLEYRGYDSAGLAVVAAGGMRVERAVGVVAHLAARKQPEGLVGIGHTRWATHGPPSEHNAHPHADCTGRIAVVHNGIIENYAELKEQLAARGHRFASDTDTEVVAHMLEEAYRGDLLAALQEVIPNLEGTYALVVVSADEPERIVAARHRSPLLLGIAQDRMLVASDATALLDHTRRVIYLDDGDTVDVRLGGPRVFGLDGREKEPHIEELTWSIDAAEKGGYEHFMLKEIHEIPSALHEVFRGRLASLGTKFDIEGNLGEDRLLGARRIVILACGTSYYAGMLGRAVLQELAGIPTEVHLASEFRHEPNMIADDTLTILVSQSGETADTLEALRRAKQLGSHTLAFVNVVGSSLAREAEGVFYLRAGPEIGVASTKAFTNMLGAFYLLGAHLGIASGKIPIADAKKLTANIRSLPRLAEQVLEASAQIEPIGRTFFESFDNAFFLGRKINHGLALEGALKLKEISYVHAEGYAAGELKHGPLALLVPGLPIVALCPQGDPTYALMTSNIIETRARGAKVLAIATESDRSIAKHADHVLRVPDCDALQYPVPAAVALYLLAYHAARGRDCSIDKPRNLAKSVTVQ